MASKFGTQWQKSRLRSWWMKIKLGLHWLLHKMRQHSSIVTGIIVILIPLVAFTFLVHTLGWDWTGFYGGFSKVTTTNTPQGTSIVTEKLPGKTLWDWMQLLIIPVILVIAGFWLNQVQKKRDERDAQQLAVELAENNQRQTGLQTYISNMSELLLEKKLRTSEPESEVRNIARTLTLIILPVLDARRKRSVLQFLYEADLIDTHETIIDLNGADLNGVDLDGLDLTGVNLSGAFFYKASFNGTVLDHADLSSSFLLDASFHGTRLADAHLGSALLVGASLIGASPIGADLTSAFLSGADLSGAKLFEANLIDADLSETNLSGADLRGADLLEVKLTGANLYRAYLKDATGITVEKLERQAKSLEGATMPTGEVHP